MPRGYRAYFDVKPGGRPDRLNPIACLERLHPERCRLVQAFGLHIDGMPRTAMIGEGDGALPKPHGGAS